MTDLQVLQSAPLLRNFQANEIAELYESATVRVLQKGEILFEQGAEPDGMYILLTGGADLMVDPAYQEQVEVGATELRRVHTFAIGESFGEMAILDGRPRSATVIATSDSTRMLCFPETVFSKTLDEPGNLDVRLLRTIIHDALAKARRNTEIITEQMLSGYFITTLVEELQGDTYQVSQTDPLHRIIVVRDADNHVISGPGRLLDCEPAKESLELYFFANKKHLRALMSDDGPSGSIALNALFSILRAGQLSERIDRTLFSFHLEPGQRRRKGWLKIVKTGPERARYEIRWEIKGARHDRNTRVSTAHIFLYLTRVDGPRLPDPVTDALASIKMPVQRAVRQRLMHRSEGSPNTRVMVLHHRTHEVARTLQSIVELGYVVDSFIGIPYGIVSWPTVRMLDVASLGNYMSLKVVRHETLPTRYTFDFQQSSYLDDESEQRLSVAFDDPDISSNYMRAMVALAELRLDMALREIARTGENLVIYEDGAYLVGTIYKAVRDAEHPLHGPVTAALKSGQLRGVVEVTVAGERKNVAVIEENGGRAIIPVMSNARSDIKACFEAIGVSEAVIHAGASALGRLGLPTFQARRIAVVGGNGAIGTRLVEDFAKMHNSTANVLVVDIDYDPYAFDMDMNWLPHAAIRLQLQEHPRYLVGPRCLPVVFDSSLSMPEPARNAQAAVRETLRFLRRSKFSELALSDCHPLAPEVLGDLWTQAAEGDGWAVGEPTPLPQGAGVKYELRRGDEVRGVNFLRPGAVLLFRGVTRPIAAGLDTIMGITGLPIMGAQVLDAYLRRPCPAGTTDELVLISGSSKDYEFRGILDILDQLLLLQAGAASAEQQLGWFSAWAEAGLCLLDEGELAPILPLLARGGFGADELVDLIAERPAIARAIGVGEGDDASKIAHYVADSVSRHVFLRKDIRPDIGTLYHLSINGVSKRLVMVADGFVVNFFARHEKGVKTEYIDTIVTMQLLSLFRMSARGQAAIPVGLHKMETQLDRADMDMLWEALDGVCRPLGLG